MAQWTSRRFPSYAPVLLPPAVYCCGFCQSRSRSPTNVHVIVSALISAAPVACIRITLVRILCGRDNGQYGVNTSIIHIFIAAPVR